MGNPLIKYFGFAHLPEGPLRDTSAKFHNLAHDLDRSLPDCAEKTVALRKLLEAKDAAVRSSLELCWPARCGRRSRSTGR